MKTVPVPKGSETKSYYKFLSEPLEPVTKEEIKHLASLKGDPQKALPFSQRARLQEADYVPAPEGVYLMEDGTIFISILVDTPDLTGEMVDWWIIWHQLDPLRYALWNPEDHYHVTVSEADRARILDESLSIRERGWGITTLITESMNGEKPMKGALPFCHPDSLGFKKELYGTDGCMGGICTYNPLKLGPIEIPMLMTEYLRKGADGRNQWVVHGWLGHGVKDGQDIKMKLPLRKLVAKGVVTLMVHMHKENRHLNKVLPKIYAENKDNWLE